MPSKKAFPQGGRKTRQIPPIAKARRAQPLTGRPNRLRKPSPQRLKPDLFANTYVRAEARTLQKPRTEQEGNTSGAKARHTLVYGPTKVVP